LSMLVCHCAAVNEASVRTAVDSGARTISEVAAQCGAGGGCGGCRPTICRLLGASHRGACGADGCASGALISGADHYSNA